MAVSRDKKPASPISSRKKASEGIGWRRTVSLLLPVLALVACGEERWEPVPGTQEDVKSSAAVRAQRRSFDGAPPTIPHENFGVDCSGCHDSEGLAVPGLGFAPASPHDDTRQAGALQRCRQCHVFVDTQEILVVNIFQGLPQDLRPGGRLYPGAPPTIPHRILMRENCAACHTGPGAREDVRTTHPDRTRCRQCHVPVETRGDFVENGFGNDPKSTEKR